MYFLDCDHCGEPNPVKTEFQTFCDHCKKKLTNNFQDWKKANPNSTFADYKQSVCWQSNLPLKKSNDTEQEHRKSKLDLIVLLSSVAVLVLLTVVFHKQLAEFAEKAYASYNASIGKYKSAKPGEWRLFTSGKGKFEINFPGDPTPNKQNVETEIGELELNMYVFTPKPGMDDNFNYVVGFTQYPAYTIDSRYMTGIEVDEFLDQSVQGSAANVNGVVIENVKHKFDSYPGRDFTINVQNGTAIMRGRSYLVNNTLYSINVIEPSKNASNQSTSQFLESFKLIE